MAKSKSPFAGMKLTEQAASNDAGPDQLLFSSATSASEPTLEKQPEYPTKEPTGKPVRPSTITPRHHDTKQPSYESVTVEDIRRAVKQLGKEAATYRFTQEEKRALAEIVYNYKRQDVNTSGNEITKIGLNYVLEDHRKNGTKSILATVLDRLNA